MKKGRRKDHVWQFVKYKGDGAVYAKCNCGFRYGCYKEKNKASLIMIPAPEKLYRYCPWCGSRKTRYIEEVKRKERYPWE